MATLRERHCEPCEGGTAALVRKQVTQLLKNVPDWRLVRDNRGIRREWQTRDFDEALTFLNRIGDVARSEDHHPDLHLIDFRNVAVELTTHAAEGLTENDFIVAAKIDALPVELKQ